MVLSKPRVLIPDIDLGGWPAVWLLGLSNLTWPRNGEIDIMEMGQRQSYRDLHDGHNGGNGLNNSTVNQVVGANAIFMQTKHWYQKILQVLLAYHGIR